MDRLARRDRNLRPLNTDYDLFSVGKDGASHKLLSQPDSDDDVIRALDGSPDGITFAVVPTDGEAAGQATLMRTDAAQGSVEVGGILSHASTVAREYGLPALANVKQATTRLQTGDRVRLNASAGTAELIRTT